MVYLKNMEDVRKFKGERHLYCYGNGVIGRDFFYQCKEHGVEISGYVISNDQVKHKSENENIKFLSEFMSNYQNEKIIITTDKKFHKKIEENLKKIDFPNVSTAYLIDLYEFVSNVFHEDVEYRKGLSLFDYKSLAKPLRFVTKRHTDINFYYGNEKIIKKALNITSQDDLLAEIEHSPRGIDNLIIDYEVDQFNEYGDTIYVSSKDRKKFLEEYLPNKKIISVGLYIKYAEKILSDKDFEALKKKLGKVLLVFPYHSTGGFSCNFEPKILLSEIKKHEKDFDNILVCMYWFNVTQGHEDVFKKRGYKVVTAGNIYDYYFLYRLRTIIELSDMTISNAIGTHIAFCTCFNKPHYIVREKLCGNLSEGQEVNDSIDYLRKVEHLSIVPADIERFRMIHEHIYNAFGNFQMRVTEEQKKIVQKYFGEW